MGAVVEKIEGKWICDRRLEIGRWRMKIPLNSGTLAPLQLQGSWQNPIVSQQGTVAAIGQRLGLALIGRSPSPYKISQAAKDDPLM